MASMASLSPKPSDSDVPIEEIIFSCAICQATVSEVYATTESNQGFHSGSGDEDGIVTKMWITECSHITCAKHLKNGAAPFHPKGLAPRAPCPKCLRDKGDETLKNLYGIRGLDDGEYDSTIPSEWRQCPAIKLDSSVAGMSAVRFQYMALCHYALQVRKHWKSAAQKQSAMETLCSKERKQRRQLQSELQVLKQRVEALEKSEAKLKKWEERKPMIHHYLGVCGRMTRDMESMRKQLLHFGVAVPETKYAFEHPQTVAEHHSQSVQTKPDTAAHIVKTNGSFAAGPYEYEDSSSSRKRKRDDNSLHGYYQGVAQQQRPSEVSRELMPPPLPKSMPRLLTNRELPMLHTSSAARKPPASRNSIQVYHDGNWRSPQENPYREQTITTRYHTPYQNGVQLQRELPYRPSITPIDRAPDGPQEYSPYAQSVHRVESDFRKPTDANRDAALGNAGHTTESPHSQQNLVHGATDKSRPIVNEMLISQGNAHNPTTSSNTGYRYIMRHDDERHRAPLKLLSEFDTNRREASTPQAHLSRVARSSHRVSEAQGSSVPSPFFRRDVPAFSSSITQRPSRRGNFVASQYDAPIYDETTWRMTITPYAQRETYLQPQAFDSVSPMDSSRQQCNLQSLYKPPFSRPNMADRHQRKAPAPQTPRNSQFLFHRPDRPPPSASYTAAGVPSDTHFSGVSQIQSHGPLKPTGHVQDEALLQVPGVRGVSSQRDHSSYQRPGPAQETPKNLFSSTGGRRSVRR